MMMIIPVIIMAKIIIPIIIMAIIIIAIMIIRCVRVMATLGTGLWALQACPGLSLEASLTRELLNLRWHLSFRDGFASAVSCKLALVSGDTRVQVPSAEPKLVAKLSRAQNRTGRAGVERGIRSGKKESFLECQSERAPANQMGLVENTEVKDSKR